MGRRPKLKASVFEAIMDVAVRDFSLLQREYSLWQTIRVNIVGIVVFDSSGRIPGEEPAHSRKYRQRQQLQPKVESGPLLFFLSMSNQLVGKYSEKLGHDFQEIPAPLGPAALRKIGTGDLPIPQDRREALPVSADVWLAVHDYGDNVVHSSCLDKARRLVVYPVLAFDVGLRGIR